MIIFDYDLIMLDIDNTLTEEWSLDWRPGVEQFLSQLAALPADRQPRLALVTNQGGPACHDAGWEFSDKFPSLDEVQQRLRALCQAIEQATGQYPALYVAWVYKTRNGNFLLPSAYRSDNPAIYDYPGPFSQIASQPPGCDPNWRKPEPGMLLQAMQDADVLPDQAVMVGDGEADRGAAEAAGVTYFGENIFIE